MKTARTKSAVSEITQRGGNGRQAEAIRQALQVVHDLLSEVRDSGGGAGLDRLDDGAYLYLEAAVTCGGGVIDVCFHGGHAHVRIEN